MSFRIGLGTDLHRLGDGKALMIGGVNIPSHKGSIGHSDGDVLIHAICDAFLGAIAARDIGYHFPDNDPENKDASSISFLKAVINMVESAGWKPVNIDATIHLEQPKLSPHIDSIRQSLAAIIGISAGDISVKAKTGERIGLIGGGEAIEALAVCLISR